MAVCSHMTLSFPCCHVTVAFWKGASPHTRRIKRGPQPLEQSGSAPLGFCHSQPTAHPDSLRLVLHEVTRRRTEHKT
eukprot:571610-Amphidinium_carterae.1